MAPVTATALGPNNAHVTRSAIIRLGAALPRRFDILAGGGIIAVCGGSDRALGMRTLSQSRPERAMRPRIINRCSPLLDSVRALPSI